MTDIYGRAPEDITRETLELVDAERRRQRDELGWSPEHDAQHRVADWLQILTDETAPLVKLSADLAAGRNSEELQPPDDVLRSIIKTAAVLTAWADTLR